jgi:hypothetical protein
MESDDGRRSPSRLDKSVYKRIEELRNKMVRPEDFLLRPSPAEHYRTRSPAIPGLKSWPLTVAASATGTGLRRAAIVKQVASAMVMSLARRSGGSSLSSDSSV